MPASISPPSKKPDFIIISDDEPSASPTAASCATSSKKPEVIEISDDESSMVQERPDRDVARLRKALVDTKKKLQAKEEELKLIRDSVADIESANLADTNCPVCTSTMQAPVITPCGHSFCAACMMQVFVVAKAASRPLSCPTCRGIIKKRPIEAYAFKNIIHRLNRIDANVQGVPASTWDKFFDKNH